MNRAGVALTRTVSRSARVLAVQVVFLVFIGGLVVVSRRYLDLSLGIPGHTGFLWMFFMVVGVGMVQRKGAGLLIGASAAVWGEVFGLPRSFGYNMVMYSLAGLTIDMTLTLLHLRAATPLGGMVAGTAGHIAKYVFHTGYSMKWAIASNALTLGIATSLGFHILFGAAGGLLGGLVLWRGKKVISRIFPTE